MTKIKQRKTLPHGWEVQLIADPPYDDLIRLISPWGEHTNLVKNEATEQVLWRYFATVLHQPNEVFLPTTFPVPQDQGTTNVG